MAWTITGSKAPCVIFQPLLPICKQQSAYTKRQRSRQSFGLEASALNFVILLNSFKVLSVVYFLFECVLAWFYWRFSPAILTWQLKGLISGTYTEIKTHARKLAQARTEKHNKNGSYRNKHPQKQPNWEKQRGNVFAKIDQIFFGLAVLVLVISLLTPQILKDLYD